MNKIILILILIIIIASCEFTAPERYTENKLVIAGFLKAGENLTIDNAIFVGKTVSVQGDQIEDILLDDANVSLINTTTQDTFMLSFEIDLDQYDNLIFGYCNNSVIIQPSVKYRIEVTARIDSQQVFAWAETEVPEIVDIELDHYGNSASGYGFSDVFPEIYPQVPYNKVDNDFPIYLSLNDNDILYLSYQFYCMEEFSTNLEYTEPFADFTHLDPEDEDNYNSIMSNNIRESEMLWRYQPHLDEYGNWYLEDDAYKEGFRFYGRWKLTIYSTDINFYTYNYHSENYLHGGIKGGIGYFGSVAGEDFYTKITKQDK